MFFAWLAKDNKAQAGVIVQLVQHFDVSFMMTLFIFQICYKVKASISILSLHKM